MDRYESQAVDEAVSDDQDRRNGIELDALGWDDLPETLFGDYEDIDDDPGYDPSPTGYGQTNPEPVGSQSPECWWCGNSRQGQVETTQHEIVRRGITATTTETQPFHSDCWVEFTRDAEEHAAFCLYRPAELAVSS